MNRHIFLLDPFQSVVLLGVLRFLPRLLGHQHARHLDDARQSGREVGGRLPAAFGTQAQDGNSAH